MEGIRGQVTNALRKAIVMGTFLPRQELNDGLLCRHFGVSRTTIREALRYLEAERLIVVKTNRRTYVRYPSPEERRKIFHLLGVLFGQAIVNISCFDSRKRTFHVRRNWDLLCEMEKISDPVSLQSIIFQFYDDVLKYTENSVIADCTRNLFWRVGMLRVPTLSDRKRVASIQDELKAILKSLGTGDTNAMRQTTHAHFDAEWNHTEMITMPMNAWPMMAPAPDPFP